MDGLVDNRDRGPDALVEVESDSRMSSGEIQEHLAPLTVRAIFTPITSGTLVAVVTRDYRGRLTTEQRVFNDRLPEPTRLDWAVDGPGSLRVALAGLAALLDA